MLSYSSHQSIIIMKFKKQSKTSPLQHDIIKTKKKEGRGKCLAWESLSKRLQNPNICWKPDLMETQPLAQLYSAVTGLCLMHQQLWRRAWQAQWDISRPWQEQPWHWQGLGTVGAPWGGSVVILSEDIRGLAPDSGSLDPLGCYWEGIADTTLLPRNSSMVTSEMSLRQSQRHWGETEVEDVGYLKSRWREILCQSCY